MKNEKLAAKRKRRPVGRLFFLCNEYTLHSSLLTFHFDGAAYCLGF